MPSIAATSAARVAAPLDAQALAAALQTFFTDNPRACVVEDGTTLFEMARAHWSVRASAGRCVLQLWSEERNLQRTVVGLRERRDSLRLEVSRMGQARPQVLHLAADSDRRSPSTRDNTRRLYATLLARVLARAFPDLRQGESFIAADLQHSFGPAYVRTTLFRGQTVWAVIAINNEETQSAVDGALTVGLLWLERCRSDAGGRRLVEGLKLILPPGMYGSVRERLTALNPAEGRCELWELDERREELAEVAPGSTGNLKVELPWAFDPASAIARLQGAVQRVLALLPPAGQQRVELHARSATELSFRLHGLEFARVRHGVSAHSFAREEQVTFGAGANETELDEDTEPLLRELLAQLFASRQAGGRIHDPLFRMQPERWLESVLRADVSEIEPMLRPAPVYTQVPALASADRGMLDLLAVTRDGRLAVLELKAGEDLHMPLQGLDYWLRVRALHAGGAFTRSGYFVGVELSPEPPLLFFVVPALRVHSTVDTLLRALSPEVEWRLLALDERWRERRRVIFRKSGGGVKPWPRVFAGNGNA